MKVQKLKPTLINVKEGLDRYREEMGELKQLGESIERYGQLQPIIITENFELIAGGRRLAACLLKGLDVYCTTKDNLSNLEIRVTELEENLQRKDFTPAEECAAISDIHSIKISEFGQSNCYSEKGENWGMQETAEMLGMSKTNVSKLLGLNEIVKNHPELSRAKSLSDISKAGKALQAVSDRMDAEESFKQVVNTQCGHEAEIHLMDSTLHMKQLKDNSIDILLTDPPYGIDIDIQAISIGGETGKFNTAGYTFDDSKLNALSLYKVLAEQSFKFCKNTSHAYVFLAPEFFHIVGSFFKESGWDVAVRPLIWIKKSSGQNNAPHCWASSCYEMCLYARRKNSKLILQGKPDWFQFDPVSGDEKVHPTQKPVELIQELIRRSSLPGQTLYDPFMGSGASMVAGLKEKLLPIGCDILEQSYMTAKMQLRRYKSSCETETEDGGERGEENE